MRICAIRGCNLASLHGAFSMDLERGALGKVGLFAITGPTGAGKSTLLDAMCLALYDKIPRLEGARGRVRGHADVDDLTAKDVRSILRNDTARGYAEVEFIGMDQGRYRARWSIRRARNQATGALQAATLELHDVLSGATVFGPSDPKTPTKARIEELVGLTYDQFRRSALLAQGDFAAFLEAPPRDRAQLLERMTGTEIYARLSVAAFERERDAKTRIQAKSMGLDQLGTLSDEDRKALQREATRARQHKQEAAERLAVLERARTWSRDHQALERGLATAVREREEAEVQARPSWAAELARNQALAPLRPLRDGAVRAAGARQEAATALEQAAASAHQAKAEARQREQAFERARTAHEAATTLAVDQARELQEARDLDAQLRRQEAVRDDRLEEAKQAASTGAAAAAELAAIDQEVAALARQRGELVLEDEGLAPTWPAVEAALHRLGEAREALGEVDEEAVRSAEEDAATARTALAGARAAYEALEPARLRERRAVLDLQEQLLRVCEAGAAAAERAGRERASWATALEQAKAARARIAGLEPRHTQAGRALRQAEATRDLAARRADLVEGEACPLCGATEHPSAQDTPLEGLVEQLRRDHQGIASALRTAAQELAGAESLAGVARREAEEAEARTRAAESAAEPLRARLQEAPMSRAAVEREEEELRRAEGALTAAEARREELDEVATRAETRARELRQATQRVAGAAQTARDAREELRQLLDDRTLEAAEADPGGTLASLRERMRRLANAQERARALAKRSAEAQGRLSGLRTAAQRTRETAEEEARQARQAEATLQGLLERRRGLLGGRLDTDRVAAEREGELAASGRAEAEARERWTEARQGAAVTAKGLEEAARQARVAEETLRARSAELETGLADAGVARADLDQGLSWSAEETSQRARELERLVQRRTSALTLEQERRRKLAEHQDEQPKVQPDPDEEAAANTAFAQAEEAWVKLQGELEADAQNRQRGLQLRAEVEQLAAEAAVWRTLSSCIGSASGSRFREFAQGLTLERLIAHANQQLRDLAPRYELMRVPGEDLEIQVKDTAMGDEVRTVASLSGGETFLVSLALALGLASMSSDRKVESLFIDEGFGALDQRSLELALATLDALQATGRKVGVISHVRGLAEQIGVQVQVVPDAPGRSSIRLPP